MVNALILAAGASRRMGRPKALLPLSEGESFLSRIVETLRKARVDDVTVVLGAGAEEIRSRLGWFAGAIVENPRWEEGQLSSIIAGLDALSGNPAQGTIIWPVDHPLVGAETVRGLVTAFERSGKQIIVPVCRGRRGHPVLFSARLFPSLRTASPEVGAREVLRRHPGEVLDVETGDEEILRNIDTPVDARDAVSFLPVP